MKSAVVVVQLETSQWDIRSILKTAGFVVYKACHGDSALAHCQREATGVVILDVGIIERDGLEFLRALRAIHHNMPIIAVSETMSSVAGLYLNALKDYKIDATIERFATDDELVAIVSETLPLLGGCHD